MIEAQCIFVLIFLIVIQVAYCDVLFDITHREDTCITLCEKIPLSSLITTVKSIENDKIEEAKSCCQRGCRFFNLIHYDGEVRNLDFNDTTDSCDSSCKEAYSEPQKLSACTIGCKYMAKQKIAHLVSLLSFALYIDEGIDPNVLVMSLDMPDNDIMSDPGLKKELQPGWWDTTGFKLPQTFFKSVPRESMTLDYNIPPDYSGEVDQTASVPGSDWLQCASKHTGIPRWLLGLFMAVGATLSVWLCVFGKTPDTTDDNPSNNYNNNISSKIVLLYPDEICEKAAKGYTKFSNDNEENNVKV